MKIELMITKVMSLRKIEGFEIQLLNSTNSYFLEKEGIYPIEFRIAKITLNKICYKLLIFETFMG